MTPKKIIYIFSLILALISLYLLTRPDMPLPSRIVNNFANKTQTLNSSSNLSIQHIAIIVMENKPYPAIVGNSEAPFINSLIQKYGLAQNYHAVTNPSLPNYIALLAGDTYGINSDCQTCFLNKKNLVDQLDRANISWKAYMESMPSSGCFVGNAATYAQKHNPFIYFNDIKDNPKVCANIVPLSQLATDLKTKNTTPDFIWITPNLCNDMHDCSVATGDAWLKNEVPIILNSQAFTKQNSVLFITWDEGDTLNNRIATLLIGNSVKTGYKSQIFYTHYSLLKTIENLWNLPYLTQQVSQSASMLEFFKKG